MTGTITALRVATDFSPAAEPGLRRAAQLAAQLKVAHGTVYHALDRHYIRAIRDLLPVLSQMEKERGYAAEDGLKAASRRLEEACGVPFMRVLQEGDASEVLVEGTGPNDLVVIAAKGESNLSEVLLGSTTERVVRRSHGPVLVVRRDNDSPYSKVLVPVDFSPDSKGALNLAREIAPDAQIIVLHVIAPLPQEHRLQAMVTDEDISHYLRTTEQRAKAELEALLASCDVDPSQVETVIEHGYSPLVIRDRIVSLGCDLVAMGKHGEVGLGDWLLGSVTQYIVNHSAQDVLIAKQ